MTGAPSPPRRRGGWALAFAAALVLAGGCGGGTPPDTAPVPLAEGAAGGQPWRLDGRRLAGQLCVSLVLVGLDQPPVGRCGIERTSLRHLEPVTTTVGGRLLVFSALPERARRVRLDGSDTSIQVEPARQAPGFPGRFLLVDLDLRRPPVTVRVFGDGGRAVVT